MPSNLHDFRLPSVVQCPDKKFGKEYYPEAPVGCIDSWWCMDRDKEPDLPDKGAEVGFAADMVVGMVAEPAAGKAAGMAVGPGADIVADMVAELAAGKAAGMAAEPAVDMVADPAAGMVADKARDFQNMTERPVAGKAPDIEDILRLVGVAPYDDGDDGFLVVRLL